MAGQSAVVQLTARIRTTAAEQKAGFQTAIADLSGQVRTIRKQLAWTSMLLLLILGTLLTVWATLATTPQPPT